MEVMIKGGAGGGFKADVGEDACEKEVGDFVMAEEVEEGSVYERIVAGFWEDDVVWKGARGGAGDCGIPGVLEIGAQLHNAGSQGVNQKTGIGIARLKLKLGKYCKDGEGLGLGMKEAAGVERCGKFMRRPEALLERAATFAECIL
jgi:hypothetical protein